jgi:hypothetical protein
MFWKDRIRLIGIARAIRVLGWAAAGLILVAGALLAAADDGQLALLLRAALAAIVLALALGLGWLIERYANASTGR